VILFILFFPSLELCAMAYVSREGSLVKGSVLKYGWYTPIYGTGCDFKLAQWGGIEDSKEGGREERNELERMEG
jgi:hypothetical protein